MSPQAGEEARLRSRTEAADVKVIEPVVLHRPPSLIPSSPSNPEPLSNIHLTVPCVWFRSHFSLFRTRTALTGSCSDDEVDELVTVDTLYFLFWAQIFSALSLNLTHWTGAACHHLTSPHLSGPCTVVVVVVGFLYRWFRLNGK